MTGRADAKRKHRRLFAGRRFREGSLIRPERDSRACLTAPAATSLAGLVAWATDVPDPSLDPILLQALTTSGPVRDDCRESTDDPFAREFSNPQSLIAFLLAGLAAEAIAASVTPLRRRALILGAVLPAVLWGSYWCLFAAVHGTGWDIELYPGQVISAALAGTAMAALVTAPRQPTPAR